MKRFESLSVALLDQIESSVCFSVQNDNDDENNSDDNDGEDDDDNEIKKVPEMSGEQYHIHIYQLVHYHY